MPDLRESLGSPDADMNYITPAIYNKLISLIRNHKSTNVTPLRSGGYAVCVSGEFQMELA